MAPDIVNLQRWAAGDKDAGRALIDRHVDSLGRFFRAKFGVDVDDYVQETFERILAAHTKLRPDSDFRAYLFAIARNVARDALRRALRGADALESSIADMGPSPSAAHLHRQQTRILLEALRRLPLDTQILLEMYYWEQLSVSQLAAVLEVAAGTIKSRLHRGRQALASNVQTLTDGSESLADTATDLDTWARSVREEV